MPDEPAPIPSAGGRATTGLRAAIGALALAAVAGWAGRWWWVFDLFANFRAHYVLGGALLGIVAVALRRRAEAAVVAVVVVTQAVAVLPLVAGRPAGGGSAGSVGSVGAAGSVLVVEHLNTHARIPVERLRGYLGETDADAVVLLHVPPGTAAALGSAPGGSFRVVAYDPGRNGDGALGLARTPGATGRRVWLDGRAGVAVVVPVGGTSVTVLGAHPSAPTSPRRAAGRDASLRAMAAFARDATGPVVVVGDLNATPWSHAFRSLVHDGRLVDSARGRGWAPTYPWWLGPFGIPIDHALHSRDLVTVGRRLRSGLGSGHRMLRVEVALRRPASLAAATPGAHLGSAPGGGGD